MADSGTSMPFSTASVIILRTVAFSAPLATTSTPRILGLMIFVMTGF